MKFVYSYNDYREFVRDFIAAQQLAGKKVSARSLSSAANLGPANYLSLILDGKRRLTVAGSLALSDLMGLGLDEVRYFVVLISYCESKHKNEKEFFREQLNELRAKKPISATKLPKDELSYDWRVPIVLMLAAGKSPQTAAKEISRQLKLKAHEAEEFLDRLLNAGLLKLNGHYELSDSYLSQRDRNSMKRSHADFLKRHSELLASSIAKRYSPEAKHIVHVLGANKSRAKALFSALERTSEECARLVADDKTEEVYVMQLHCIPLSNYLP